MNRHERISKALRGYAEMRISGTVDPWPEIRESVVGDAAVVRPHRSRRRFRLVPRTRVGLVFALLLVALFTMGAYAGSKWVFETFQGELPGGDARDLGTQLYLTQTMGDARVNVEWAYADEKRVVVGYSVEDLREDRRNTDLLPQLAGEDAPHGALPTHIVDLKDGNSDVFLQANNGKNGNYRVIGGTTFVSDPPYVLRGPVANTAVFASPDALKPDENHHFRLKIPLVTEGIPESFSRKDSMRSKEDPIPGPFYFDLKIPVRPVGIVEMNRKVEANGLTITLDRVVQSPGRPQAIICFEPPDDEHDWMPVMDNGLPGPFDLREGYLETRPVDGVKSGCWSVALPEYANSYSFTMEALEGYSEDYTAEGYRKIHGPWTFEFEVPER